MGAVGSPGNHGREGPMGPRGSKGEEGVRGHSGSKGSQGTPGKVGKPGSKGEAGSQGLPGPPGPKGAEASFVRNWKQCVFKNLNDETDNGLIKVNSQGIVCYLKKTSLKLCQEYKFRLPDDVVTCVVGRNVWNLIRQLDPLV